MKRINLYAGEIVVRETELESLRRKARAHDAYMWATRQMAGKLRAIAEAERIGSPTDRERQGPAYRLALSDFAQFVKEAPDEA